MFHIGPRLVSALCLPFFLASCSEVVRINSYPPGAPAYLDDEYIGTTPVRHVVPRSGVRRGRKWRVEYGNCTPAEGTLAAVVGGGRVVGYIFTLGFTALFKGPRLYRPVDARLTGGDCIPESASHVSAPTGGVVVTQIVGDANAAGNVSAEESAHRELSSRLRTLRDLYRRKLITEDEYERERLRAVREFDGTE